jgi:hypothetical protein
MKNGEMPGDGCHPDEGGICRVFEPKPDQHPQPSLRSRLLGREVSNTMKCFYFFNRKER